MDLDDAAMTASLAEGWNVRSESVLYLSRYRNTTGHTIDPSVMTLYRLRRYLDDIAGATRLFRAGHQESKDTRRRWHGLNDRLACLPTWQRQLG